MRIKIRLSRQLNKEVRADLSRPHPLPPNESDCSTVGFAAGENRSVIVMTGYTPIADDRYIDDPSSSTNR